MIFSVVHILLTAAITSALALIIALWRLPANMPALNDAGRPPFPPSRRSPSPSPPLKLAQRASFRRRATFSSYAPTAARTNATAIWPNARPLPRSESLSPRT